SFFTRMTSGESRRRPNHNCPEYATGTWLLGAWVSEWMSAQNRGQHFGTTFGALGGFESGATRTRAQERAPSSHEVSPRALNDVPPKRSIRSPATTQKHRCTVLVTSGRRDHPSLTSRVAPLSLSDGDLALA